MNARDSGTYQAAALSGWTGRPGVRVTAALSCNQTITDMNHPAPIVSPELALLQKRQSGQLIYFGVLLFLLGLLVGFAVPALANPRMGLSSHIEGVLNGMFLMLLGLIWTRLQLSARWLGISFGLSLYGAFANWLAMLVAALFNAGKTLTVAADGKEGHPAAEAVIMFLLVTLSLAMVIVCVAVLTGLRRGMNAGAG